MRIKYDVYKDKDCSWDDIFCSSCGNYLFTQFKKYGKFVGARPWDSINLDKCPHCNHELNKCLEF